jgi:hypothetical protein
MDIKMMNKSIFLVDIDLTKIDQFKLLVCSDIHFDSYGCDRDLLKKHFDEADAIFINGDWFDLMQGRYDPRRSYSDIRDEYKGANYLDLVREDSVTFLKPYVEKLIGFGNGNHETTVLKNTGINPLDNLVSILNYKYKTDVKRMGYSGYILLRAVRSRTDKTNNAKMYKMYFHHGTRGNAQRSKGILSADIDAKKHPDADIIIKGDDHQKWYLPMVRERLRINNGGGTANLYKECQHHIRLGSYIDGREFGYAGFAAEKDFGDVRLGGWFLNFQKKSPDSVFDVVEAK